MATPLINALRVSGGTFYTFTSSAKDLSKTFTDDDTRFVFSKFALLNLPDIATPTSNRENYIVWEALGSYYGGTGAPNSSVPSLSSDNNINFAESFQNYVLNLEQLILEGRNTLAQPYDSSSLNTSSERLFWKWLTSLQALRFRNASASEATLNNRYTEEDETSYYKRIVKYIGDIDVVNTVSKDGHSYSEVYLNVPVNHGNTPLVLFKTFSDANYFPAGERVGSSEYIDGRSSSSTHPTGLSMISFYDKDSTDSYVAQATFGDVTNIGWTAGIGSDKPIVLSKMDGVVLDTDAASYKPIVDDGTISLISEFNATDAAGDFSFNAALVYYDVYSASDPNNFARNVYGVLVLDDYINQGSGLSYLKRFDKFKPNKVTKLNGNGYGLKLNIKFDTSVDNVGVETIINDYSTFSMDMFVDASTRMQEAADMFLAQQSTIIQLKKDIDSLKAFYFAQDDLDSISTRLSALEKSLNNANLAFSSSNTLLDLINKNADNINKILSGQLSLNLTYNTDVLKNGDGLLFDKSVPNQLKISNRVQAYNSFSICKNTSSFIDTGVSNGKTFTDINNGNIIVLEKYGNYFKQVNQDPDPITGIETFDDNVYINISDKTNRRKKGQTFRFVFSEAINFNGYNLVFRTDSENFFGDGVYQKQICSINANEIISSKPIIELICLDETLYKFGFDVLR